MNTSIGNLYLNAQPTPPTYSSLDLSIGSLYQVHQQGHFIASPSILPITSTPDSDSVDSNWAGATLDSAFIDDETDPSDVGDVTPITVTIGGNQQSPIIQDVLRNRYVPPTEITNIEVYDNSVILWINAFNLNGAIVEVSYDGNHWHSLSIPQENVIGISYEGALQGKVIVPLTTNASRALYRLRLPSAL